MSSVVASSPAPSLFSFEGRPLLRRDRRRLLVGFCDELGSSGGRGDGRGGDPLVFVLVLVVVMVALVVVVVLVVVLAVPVFTSAAVAASTMTLAAALLVSGLVWLWTRY